MSSPDLIRNSKDLDTLASMKDTSALGDEADGGFGEADIEDINLEGSLYEGVRLGGLLSAKHDKNAYVWEIQVADRDGRFYFVGTEADVRSRLAALPNDPEHNDKET